jgi:hypothetical protein
MTNSSNYANNGRLWKPLKKPLSPAAYNDRQLLYSVIYLSSVFISIIIFVIIVASAVSDLHAKGGSVRELIEKDPAQTSLSSTEGASAK